MEALATITSILQSTLSSEEKLKLLHAFWNEDSLSAHTTNNFSGSSQDETQHKEGNDVISKRKDDESPTPSSSQQSKGKGALDPSMTEEIFRILVNNIISLSQDKTTTTSLEVKQSQKAEDSREKTNEVHDKSLSDETSKEIDEAKGIEASDPLIRELKEKPANNETHDQKNSPPPEQASSTIISSQTKLGEISQTRMVTKESRQVVRAESIPLTFPAAETFLVSENSTNGDGIEQDAIKIHKQEAVCKHCHKLILSEETHISIAKCECSSTLIHNQCMDAWSQENRNVCSNCDKEIRNNEVTLSLIPPQTTADNSQIPTSISKRFLCCFS